MEIKINRTISEPPKRDYSKRLTITSRAERAAVLKTLRSLEVGQSIEFTGDGAARDRIHSFLTYAKRHGLAAAFSTANIPGGIGVWRVA
jgi:hypothetical protein